MRLQLQLSALKVGAPRRHYDPAPLRQVEAVTVAPAGITARSGDNLPLCDVHHAYHPQTKNSRGKNGISLGFTGHYAAMRTRFGDHLTDGIAGENILIATDRLIAPEELENGVVIRTAAGQTLALERVMVAEPCVEFSRYAARYTDGRPSDRTVSEAVLFLRGGMRGFYAAYRGEPLTVRCGDKVWLPG